MSASTREALERAKSGGHHLVICTGRIREDLPRTIPQALFDGFICASGGHVEWKGEVLRRCKWPYAATKQLLDYVASHQMLLQFQGSGGKYVLDAQYEAVKNIWEDKFRQLAIPSVSFDGIPYASEQLCNLEVAEKALYHESSICLAQLQADLGEDFEVTGSSFSVEDTGSGEITLKGITKAAGMQHLLEYLHMDVKDSFAFGDGPNDYEMLAYAGTGIAMGNAGAELKEQADDVTADIDQDGIYLGLARYHLI